MNRHKLLLLMCAFCCSAVAESPNRATVQVSTVQSDHQPAIVSAQTNLPAAQKEDPEVFTRCRDGAGAYYQMFTREEDDTGAPYTYISADVYVGGGDTKSIKITDPGKEVAFAFLGGNGTDGWWVDAGLQYSPRVKDWSLFFWDKGKAQEVRGKPFTFQRKATPTLTPQSRFAPDQTIKLELFIPQKAVLGARTPMDNRVAVIARGRQRDRDGVRGKAQVQRYVFEVPSGWPRSGRADGRGINLRYTASLAQVGKVDLSTGSYFKGTRITNVYVGSSYATKRPLRQSDMASLCSSPNDQVAKLQDGAISIDYRPKVE